MSDGFHDLSLIQRRLWFVEQVRPGDVAYNMSVVSHVRGPLDVAALQAALDVVVARHGALRTRFVVVGGEPAQEVVADGRVRVDVVELRKGKGLAHAVAETQQPFDLAVAPLMRCTVVRVGDEDQFVVFTVHHIVFDGWSAGVFFDELTGALAHEDLGGGVAQFVDVVEWERAEVGRAEQERLVAWWTERLAGAPTVLELVTDGPRPPVQAHRGARRRVVVDESVIDGLEALGRVYGVTMFMTMLSAFGVVLSRHAGQDEVLVGTPVAFRPRAEFERAVGCLLNTVVLRIDTTGSPSFVELLSRVREMSLAAFEHQQVPFERLVAELAPDHDLSRNPLAQVFLNFEPEPEPPSFPGCTTEHVPNKHISAKFDLTLYVKAAPGRIVLDLVYDADLFSDTQVGELLDQTNALLAQVSRNPHRPVLAYPLVSPRERGVLPDPLAPLPTSWHGSVLDRLARHAAQSPDRVVMSANDGTWTYAELDRAANRLARRLLEAGVRRGDLVGVLTTRDPTTVIAMVAALKLAAPFVTMDSALPPMRLAQCVAASGPKALVASRGVGALPDDLTTGQVIRLDDAAWTTASADHMSTEIGEHDPVYAVFTSGTTGMPKCVVTTHGVLSHFFDWYEHAQRLSPDDRFAVLSGLGYEPLMRDTLMAIWVGATSCFPEHDRLDFPGIAPWLSDTRVTVAHLTPPYADELAAAMPAGMRLPDMRLVGVGGDVLRRNTATVWAALAPNASLLNYYGTTETPQAISVLSLRDPDSPGGVRPFRSKAPIGPGIDGVQILCINPAGEQCAEGEIGELIVRTPYLARYLNDDSGGFTINPWTGDSNDRVYRTGDRVRYLGQGCVEFVGRTDHQINLRGFRIEPGEIEGVLAGHERIGQALVMVREDRPGDRRLVGYVTPVAGAVAPDAAELRSQVGTTLPKHMVPSAFVVLDGFPLTVNGKIDRAGLPAPSEQWDSGDASRAPETDLERELARLWEDVLAVRGIGADDNFFALGGHSLLLTRLLARIRESFGVGLGLREVFGSPTVAGFADLVEAGLAETGGSTGSGLLPASANTDGFHSLSLVQRRLWFVDQIRPGDVAYIMSVMARVRGALDVETLQQAIDTVVDRHGALRTRFVMVGGEPVQEVVAGARVLVDVRDLPEEDGLAFATAETRRPFDLAVAPLLRCAVVRVGEADQLLVVTVHHIVFDGWSAGVFFEELLRAYQREHLDTAVAQLVDVVEWERSSVGRGEQDRLVGWWKQHLAGAPTVLELVTDRPRQPVQAHRGARRRVHVPAEVVDRLEALGRAQGATLFMTLLSAFGVVVTRHAGQDEVLVGTPVAFRPRPKFERAVGCFLNTVLMRVDTSGAPSFAQLVSRVREMSLSAFDHQQVPFERLVAELAPDHDLSRNPLYQVLFALQNMPKSPLRLPGTEIEMLQSTEAHAQCDLSLRFTHDDNGLTGALDYDVDLFEESTVDTMLGHLEAVLVQVAANTDVPVSRLELLTASARENVLTRWNDTATDWPLDRTLTDLLAEQTRRTPHAPAVRFADEELTYAELDARANALALRLREWGVGPDVVVGVHLHRSVELMVAVVAVLKAGGAYLPLEPDHPVDRLRAMVAGSGAPVVVTSSELANTFASVEVLVTDDVSDHGPRPHARPGDLAYVIYTSGSTGAPKGVQIPHRGIINRLLWMQDAYGLSATDRVLQKTPISFDVSVWELFWPLITGACVVLAAPRRHREPEYLAEFMAAEGITVCHFVPTMLSAFLDSPDAGKAAGLRLVVCSGEELPADVAERCLGTLDVRLENLYGPTEASVDVTSWSCERGANATRVLIGRPISNTRTYVLDHALGLASIGVPGELYLGGQGLARGYLHRPDLTAERFVADPYGPPGSRLYRTGDRVRWLPDGTLEFLGRIDHQVKIRGLRIEPGEIEQVLLDHHCVSHALVVVREDQPGDRRLVAYVTGPVRSEELRSLAASALPRYMVPSAFVVLDEFPLTPNGKVDRAALPAPSRERAEPSRAPATRAERELAGLWEDVLCIDGVGADDDFFELGGDSMHAIALVGRARLCGFDLTVEALFRTPTVAALAGRYEEGARSRDAAEPGRFFLLSDEDRARLGQD